MFADIKRKSKAEFTAKLEDLRTRLVGNLEQQFEREMRRGAQRIEDTIAPFDRFVRAERDRLGKQQATLQELGATVADLQRALRGRKVSANPPCGRGNQPSRPSGEGWGEGLTMTTITIYKLDHHGREVWATPAASSPATPIAFGWKGFITATTHRGHAVFKRGDRLGDVLQRRWYNVSPSTTATTGR
jgi:hypothetical protein